MRAALLLALFIAGCVATPTDGRDPLEPLPHEPGFDFGPPIQVRACPEAAACYEPSIASDALGRLYVMDASGALHVRVADGLPFLPLTPPRPPRGALAGDAHVQVDGQGRLWLSSLARVDATEHADAVWLARSDDGGLRWALNAVHPFPGVVDRQWIVPVDATEIVLTYNDVSAGVRAATSADAGASFGDAILISPGDRVHGMGLATDDGRVLVPIFHYGDPAELRLAVREGGSWSYALRVGPPGDFFPSLGRSGAGYVAAWRDADKALLVATSPDARAWSAPARWSPEETTLAASPWVVSGDTTRVTWPALDARGSLSHRLGSLEDASVRYGDARAGLHSDLRDRPAYTDFAHAATLPDGRAVVVWNEGGDRLAVAVEERAPVTPALAAYRAR